MGNTKPCTKPCTLHHGARDQIFQAPFFGGGAWVWGYVCCSMSVVSKLCAHLFFWSRKLLRLHAHLDQTSHYSYELNFWHLWVLIMRGPYLKRTQLLCVICTVCDQPTLACHSLQLPCVHLTWVVFISGFLHTDTALALSESISVELDSEGSVVSTCTGTWILMRFSTCANLKCTCVP